MGLKELSLIFFAFVVCLVVLVPISSATTYLNIYLDDTGKADFLGETSDNITLPLGIGIQDGKIKGSTLSLTSKEKDVWKFSYYQKGAEIRVILPENGVLNKVNSSEIYNERGRIAVYFYQNASVSYKIGEAIANQYNYWMIFIALLVIIITVFCYVILNKKYKSLFRKINKNTQNKKFNRIKILKQILHDREKLIIDNLSKTGRVKMSHLRKLCNLPKASFSRHIQELEKKNLIKRLGEGKNKFVELVKR